MKKKSFRKRKTCYLSFHRSLGAEGAEQLWLWQRNSKQLHLSVLKETAVTTGDQAWKKACWVDPSHNGGGKKPTSGRLGSVIPSSHEGHMCERCSLDFHTKEPQQASINGGRQTAELCRNVLRCSSLSIRWMSEDRPGRGALPTCRISHLNPHKSQQCFPADPSCALTIHKVCFVFWGFFIFESGQMENAVQELNKRSRDTVPRKTLILIVLLG